jgi:hypothetical protein
MIRRLHWHLYAVVGLTVLFLVVASADAQLDVVLPLERNVYVVGEQVPLAVVGAERPVELSLEPADEATASTIVLHSAAAGPMKLDTSRIAPGEYTFHLGGMATGVKITLVPAERPSAAALLGEFVTGLGNKGLIENLRQSELNAYFGLGSRKTLMRQEPLHDETLKLQLMMFAHPTTRPTSFKPPRAWDHEMDDWGILLAQGTQMQLRYPAFGGICFEWDAGNIIRKPSIFFNFRDYDQPWLTIRPARTRL